ncbi:MULTISPECIES: type II toxin-antitoxin system Phd/YefM family antitoxin [Pseudomonas]|jgi:prevent-host-death family protein|uniref:Antitoxin n=1 Tax=Pseudomonas citronellolis TaxID=53408 RepID=A0AAW6NYK5_9PSED|nr:MULTISPECIES: type II toxin-antitoxin system prevent-host-death family antitoxin [Pseudomonas]KES20003.1 prevent-host-death protein [Pseudomonas sp. AAC]MCP1640424.1 prevent-host-death family protein [Pseudomonas citronellolis]MCP1663344.1 prevent-host-death family protein [Pseudomonas citronellolis]MCP1697544.1 prevent-host-death family protein [Pseudomonas citronellolis]MCP1701845.1 prevent-host-death family protein [Pseudomonas citronellolis]
MMNINHLEIVNIHDAKTNLSKLVDQASKGAAFVIARAGKPLVKVTAISDEPVKRIGMLEGQIVVPDDIDSPFAADIEAMFYGKS